MKCDACEREISLTHVHECFEQTADPKPVLFYIKEMDLITGTKCRRELPCGGECKHPSYYPHICECLGADDDGVCPA